MRHFLTLLLIAPAAWSQAPAPVRVVDPGGANLPAQKIGANDLIAVSVYDAPEFTRTIRVDADGSIRLPMLRQPVRADGLLPVELETAVARALAAEEILVDPYVTVTVVEYDSRPVSVPGSPAALVRRISAKALIAGSDSEVNLPLYGGEQIRVPALGKIFIVGNVKKPGVFSLQDDDETTVLKAVALSEGLAPYSSKVAYIIRRDDRTGHKNEIPIELKSILARKSADVSSSDTAENPRIVPSVPGSPTIRDPFGNASEISLSPSPFGRIPSRSRNSEAFRTNSPLCLAVGLTTRVRLFASA